MKRIDFKTLLITVVVCLLPLLAGLYFYNELPQQMAVHFNVQNEADNFAPKGFALFGIPLILAVLQILCSVLSDIKTGSEKPPLFVALSKWIVPAVSMLVCYITITVGLGHRINIRAIVCVFLALMFVLLGNYMPKMPFETAQKVLSPAPSNEKQFRTMTKMFGITIIIFGILLILSLLLPPLFSLGMIFLMIIVLSIETVVYTKKTK